MPSTPPSFTSSLILSTLSPLPPPHALTGQFEELKRVKDSLEEEVHPLKAYKRECGHLKAEYNAIKLKVSRPCAKGVEGVCDPKSEKEGLRKEMERCDG